MPSKDFSPLHDLIKTFELERIEKDIYRGISPNVGWQRVFGGHVICQSLIAAQQTVAPDRHIHSLHCYFMRPGDPKNPIVYNVDRIRDGGSFTTRRVIAIQHGEAIFSMSASFHKIEKGLEHQIDMPEGITLPENLPTETELRENIIKKFDAILTPDMKAYLQRKRAIEIRPVDQSHYLTNEKLDPIQDVWMRTNGDLPEVDGISISNNSAMQAALLAYASDMTLLDTSLFAHGTQVADPNLQVASLDHAMWFHRPINFEEWHLYHQDSPKSVGGRGFSRGSIYNLKGELVASCAQEGLIRFRSRQQRKTNPSGG